MTETLTLDDRLTFTIRRSLQRESLGITVDRDGSLILAVPNGCPIDEARSFAESKREWIFTKLAEKALFRQPRHPKQYVEGEGHYYLGRSYRLRLLDDADPDTPPLRLYRGRFVLRADERESAEEYFGQWYISHGQAFIKTRVERYRDRLGVDPESVTVRPLGYRWGSCTPEGALNFHWQTVMLPVQLIDYVVVHEMSHLHDPLHDASFWRRVERVMPDYERRKQVLAEEGGGYL